jgi:hypothetical protein
MGPGHDTGYGLVALERELAQLLTAEGGDRNHRLNRAAFCLGMLVAGGELSEGRVHAELAAAGEAIGLDVQETERTIGVSGVTAPKRRKSLPQILVRRSKAPLRQHVRQFDLGSSRQPEADDLLNFLQDQADQLALFCVCTMP